MTEVTAVTRSKWDEVMLAMDVVDTLRHREAALDQILNEQADQQALIEKVKRIYAAQGIEVSERLIVDAVAALKEERFSYRPPSPGFKRWLAHFYIDRVKWAKRTTAAAAVVGAVGGGSYAIDNYRESRALAQQQEQVATARRSFTASLQNLQQQRQAAKNLVASLSQPPAPQITAAAVGASRAEGEARLAELELHLSTLEQVNPEVALTTEALATGGLLPTVTSAMRAAQAAGPAAMAALNEARQLATTESRYHALAARAAEVASGANARQAVRDRTTIVRSALTAGDTAAATSATDQMQALVDAIAADYQLRIVSRPGVRSGVWRHPNNNRSIRNYYVVVEAIDRANQTLTLPITSEETGQTSSVKLWGLRVSENVFEQVKQDKLDDGIIQNNIFARKPAGRLQPEYRFNTTGGAITRW